MVKMYETKTVEVKSCEEQEVFTYGLCGCTAVAIISELQNGVRNITLSHYPPTARYVAAQCSDLSNALKKTPHYTEDCDTRHAVLIVTPAYRHYKGSEWILDNDTVVTDITKEVKANLPGIEPQILPYTTDLSLAKSQAFILKVPSELGKPVTCDGTHEGEVTLCKRNEFLQRNRLIIDKKPPFFVSKEPVLKTTKQEPLMEDTNTIRKNIVKPSPRLNEQTEQKDRKVCPSIHAETPLSSSFFSGLSKNKSTEKDKKKEQMPTYMI